MVVAASTWIGAAASVSSTQRLGLFGAAVIGAIVGWRWVGLRWVWVAVAFVMLGVVSAMLSSARVRSVSEFTLPTGRVEATIRIAEDPSAMSYGLAVAEVRGLWGSAWHGPRVAVSGLPGDISVGATALVSGVMTPGERRVRGEVVAGLLSVDRIVESRGTSNPIVASGNLVRRSVRARYDGSERVDGLLSGFLIGDTDLMLASDEENLRRAGLAHFVAVSGSNVALFLLLWWFVTAPLSIRPRLRVLVGFFGLALFAVVTRWEPSVVRASVMAAVPLAGGWLGIPVDPWMALGTAVTVLILASAGLVNSVGFQLSVAATIGVLVGLRLARDRRPKWLWLPLCTTVGAQIAVAPIILTVFGTIPLAAPLTNLIAGPVVATSTVLATVGVVVAPVGWAARLCGNAVLWVAQFAADGPQLDFAAAALVAVGAWLATYRPSRPIALALILVAVAAVPWTHPWPTVATVTVLDVGQGDAILLQTADGGTMLMDGGADPAVLDRALRRHGVGTIDRVVVSHADHDHAGGLVELIGAGRARVVLVGAFAPIGSVEDAAQRGGVPVIEVEKGDTFTVGTVRVEVLSPARRYASDNDGSVALLLTGDLSILLPGDLEAVAQAELPHLRPDAMVVPHHGSRTTDLRWLAATVGSTAVLSFGPNRYGHPHPDVVAVLDEMAVWVRSTHEDGDVSIPLDLASR